MKTRFKAYLPSKNKQFTSLTQTPKMVLTRKPDYMSPMQRQYKAKKKNKKAPRLEKPQRKQLLDQNRSI